MAQRAIDFSLMSRREIDCRWTPLSHDAMVAVLPPDHPLAKADAFPIERLLDEPFVELYPGEDCDNSRTLATAGIDVYKRQGVPPQKRSIATRLPQVQKRCV